MPFEDAAAAVMKGDVDAVRAELAKDESLAREEDIYDEVMESVDTPAGMAMAPIIGTLLHIAAKYGRVEVARVLLDSGADANHLETVHWAEAPADRRTPLYVAVWGGNSDMVSLLVERGAEVNQQSGPVDAPKRPLEEAAYHGFTDIARTLLEARAEAEAGSREISLLLSRAIQGQSKEIVELLLAGRAQVNRVSDDAEAPLLLAARHNCPEIVRILLEHGAETKEGECDGSSLLSIAASAKAQWKEFVEQAPEGPERDWRAQNQEQHLKLVQVLLESGSLKMDPGGLNHVRSVFNKFDANGDGAVDEDELVTILQALDQSWTQERIRALIAAADVNKDGKIQFDEFLVWAFGDSAEAAEIRAMETTSLSA